MDWFDWNTLATVVDGTWSTPPTGPGVQDICFDSRRARPGSLFCALAGNRVHGHDFVKAAARAGAVAALVTRPQNAAVPQLVVADTLRAYQQLAGAHRRRLTDLQVIAISGSAGKTTTKELIAQVLASDHGKAVWRTRGNANTQIGVPETLLGLTAAHRFAVVELGASLPGELARLARTTRPDLAVLTHIGHAHLAGFGDLDGVAREKASLFDGLAPGGTAVLWASLAMHPGIQPRLPDRVITVADGDAGAPQGGGAAVTLAYLGGDLTTARFRANRDPRPPLDVTWSLPGRHMAQNAALAIAVADHLGLEDRAIRRGLQRCRLPGHRMRIREHRGVTWIADAYNANPDSVRALIAWLGELPPPSGRIRLVLGDMLELGDRAEAIHREILDHAAAALPDAELLPLGPIMEAVAPPWLQTTSDMDHLRSTLHSRLCPGDLVALKGSRGLALEELLPAELR